jgi:hypothetical protein
MKERDFERETLSKYIGDLSQIAGVRHFEFKSGRAKGVEAFEVRTGGGLNYTVLADRCLDIAWAEFKGVPFSYISNVGIAAPTYFEPSGFEYFRNFTAGLMSTCGLTYLGAPCNDQGNELGLHGRIGNTAAEEVSAGVRWNSGAKEIVISGKMREAKFFGENLCLERKICSPLGQNKILITDNITNAGFTLQPFMILYHINFGYPLLQPNSEIIAPVHRVIPRDSRAMEGISGNFKIEPPQKGYSEQVFYWDLDFIADGYTALGLVNEEIGFGVYEKFKKEQLPRFIQWKQMGEGFYVMGLEPGNCYPEGRAAEREKGTLEYLEPGETKRIDLEIGILDGEKEIEQFRNLVQTRVSAEKC